MSFVRGWICSRCFRSITRHHMPTQAEMKNLLSYQDWLAIVTTGVIPQVKMPRKLPADQLMAWSEAMQERQERAKKVGEVYAGGI